jgi:hypothetical protein
VVFAALLAFSSPFYQVSAFEASPFVHRPAPVRGRLGFAAEPTTIEINGFLAIRVQTVVRILAQQSPSRTIVAILSRHTHDVALLGADDRERSYAHDLSKTSFPLGSHRTPIGRRRS